MGLNKNNRVRKAAFLTNSPKNTFSRHTISTEIRTASSSPKYKSANNILLWFIPADAIALICAFALAWLIAVACNGIFLGRYELIHPIAQYGNAFFMQLLIIGCGCLLWFYHTGHYRMRMPFWLESKKITYTFILAMMVNCFLLFATKQAFSRLWLVTGWLFAAILISIMRSGLRMWARRLGVWDIPTLLIGSGETARNTHFALRSDKALGYTIVDTIADLRTAFLHAGRSWKTLCRQYGVGYIIIALDGEEMAEAKLPIAQLMRESIPFCISPQLCSFPVMGMMPQYFINHDVMILTRNHGLEQPLPRSIKRLFDIVASSILLLLVSPFFLLIASVLQCTGGSVFFGHQRIGRGGAPFSCFKFRSMAVDNNELLEQHLTKNPSAKREWNETQKLKDDPRITRFGAFLRHYSIDELPQLFNVLKGDMSMVGPRPIVAGEIAKYEGDIAYYYSVNPGITGLWQVSGRNDVTYDERVHMDSWYVRNWSLWHDLAILLKTLPALIKRNGAY